METVDFLRDLGQALRSAGGVMSPEAFRANAAQDEYQMQVNAQQKAAQAAKADEWAKLHYQREGMGITQRHQDEKEVRAEYQNSSVSNPQLLDGTPNPSYVPFDVYARASGVNVPSTGLGQPSALTTPATPEVSSVADVLKVVGTDTAPEQTMSPAPAVIGAFPAQSQPQGRGINLAPVQGQGPAALVPAPTPALVQPRGVNLQSAAAQHQGMIAQQEQAALIQKQKDIKNESAVRSIDSKYTQAVVDEGFTNPDGTITPVSEAKLKKMWLAERSGYASKSTEEAISRSLVPMTESQTNAGVRAEQRLTLQQKALDARIAAASGGDIDPAVVQGDAARLIKGEPMNNITRGMGRDAIAYQKVLKKEAYQTLMQENGFTASEAGRFITKAGMEYKGDLASNTALEKIATGQEKIGDKLKLDMDNLTKLLPAGNAGSVKILNVPINKIRSWSSDPAFAPFALQAELVSTEFMRQMAGNGLSIAQLSVEAQQNAHKIINGDMSVAEIQAIYPTIINDMQNVKAANDKTKYNLLHKYETGNVPAPAPTTTPPSGAGWSAKIVSP
jgi:hypothetical protein